MMFAKLIEASDAGRTVWVSPRQVTHLVEEAEDRTVIFLTGGAKVAVRATAEEAMRLLDMAASR